jgi:hypothetical protein
MTDGFTSPERRWRSWAQDGFYRQLEHVFNPPLEAEFVSSALVDW